MHRPALLGVAFSFVALVVMGGCKEKNTVQPTDCSQKTVTPSTVTFNASDGTSTAAVTAPTGCAWTASTSTPWVTVTSGASGTGPGTVVFGVRGNSGPSRSGTAIVADKTVTLLQDGAPAGCSYAITPSGYSMAAAGGSFVVQVSTLAGCPWSYDSAASWLTVGPLTAGLVPTFAGGEHRVAGPLYLEVGVRPTTETGARQGSATIAGQTLTVLQDGTTTAACSYALSPQSATFPPSGGSGSLTVTTGTNCSWSIDRAADAEDWIPSLFSGRKVGTATVSYSVLPNRAFQSRSGRLLLYGTQPQELATHVVYQGTPTCLYSVSPTQATVPAAGGTGTFVVTAQPGDCSWTATPNASWLAIVSGSSGTGTRTVTYRADVSSGAARKADIAVSGLTGINPPALFTLTQSAAAGARR
jgi:hypothetical protein